MPIKEQAQTYVNNILSLLSDKKNQADAVISKIKDNAKVIDGVPYLIPTAEDSPKTTKEFSKLLNREYSNIIDPLEIKETSSAIIEVTLTECPTTPSAINPHFSKDEVEKVIFDTAAECETRGVQSKLLQGVPLTDAVKALCDITAPVIAQPASYPTALSLPITGTASLINGNNDSPFATLVEPNDSLKKPNKSIIVLQDIKTIGIKGSKSVKVTQLKKIGDRVNCGEPLMLVGSGTILCPIKSGVIKKIYVSSEAKNKDRLILLEESLADDVINNTITKANDISAKLNELTKLKEQLGKLEPTLWTKKLVAGIYEGQLQGYTTYYKSFNDLIKQRDDLIKQFNKNKSDAQKLIGNDLTIYEISSSGVVTSVVSHVRPSQQAIDDVNKIVIKQKQLLSDIGAINSQIDILRKDQPTYFAIEGGTQSLGAAEKNTNPLETVYKFVPFNPGQRSTPTIRQIDLLGNLSQIVLQFTNDLLINTKHTPDVWKSLKAPSGQLDLDINQPNFFSWNELLPGSQNFEFIFKIGGFFGNNTWKGSMYQTKKDFYDSVTKISDGIKAGNAIDDKTQQSLNEIRTNERLLPSKIESLANQTYDQIVTFSKQFGYIQINQESAFIQQGTDKTSALAKLRDDTKANFDKDYVVYLDILKKIAAAEALIDNFPNELQQSLTGGCVIKDMSAPSASIVDNDKVNIYQWPKGSMSLPSEDLNFRGNPQPNSPAMTEFSYWQKYCQNATTVNLLPTFWPIGLLIPTPAGLLKIPLPIIWTPFTVIPTPLCVIVIGLAICGICPAPFIYIVNPGWPFPISVAGPNESWHVTGIRGPAQISGDTTSKVLSAIPAITTNLKYTSKGVKKEQAVTIDAAPFLTKVLPFVQDDLPSYERLSLGNLPYTLYLTSWCSAGKKTMGFFENP